MSQEAAFIAALRCFVTDPAARGLLDDAAVLPFAGTLVLTHDMLVEGVHFLSSDPPADVAWKLVAVNLSDLAAKGAQPIGVLTGCGLGGDAGWDGEFAKGLGAALAALDVALLGGDTVRMPVGAPRTLGLTALGRAAEAGAPARSGAQPGDLLWLSGTIGDAGLGLRIAQGELVDHAELLARFRRPQPRLALGQALAPHVTAMADVSDGLLIDAARMATASNLAMTIDLDAIPLSDALVGMVGASGDARMAAATAGDDYELLFAAQPAATEMLSALSLSLEIRLSCVGRFDEGTGLTLHDHDGPVPLPARLGYDHGA